MCALRDAYSGAGRSPLQSGVWPRYAPPGLFVGYRLERARKFGLPRAGVSTPPPLVSPLGFSPSSGGGIELPRHSSGDGLRVEPARIFITFAAVYFASCSMPPLRGAVAVRVAELSGQRGVPRPAHSGGRGPPSPLFPPPPLLRRESGARYARGFFFGYRVGGGGGGWVRLTRPRVRVGGVRPAPYGRAAPPRRRVRCVRSRRGAAAPYGTRRPRFGRVRAAAAAPIAYASLDNECLGSPKKTATLGDSRSRPPRNPVFLGTLPATFIIEMKLLLLSSGALPP